jgi:hypothetical protein
MMGLLDDLFARPNQGGILNGAYPSPLMEPKKQYATNDFDSEFLPQQPSPFGPLPVPPRRSRHSTAMQAWVRFRSQPAEHHLP